MDKETAQALLPEVGTRMVRIPNLHKSLGLTEMKPCACVVEYVNKEHLWYTVRFENGFTESYKVPEIEPDKKGGWDKRRG